MSYNLKKLIKLANHLDRSGYVKEADYLDLIIKTSALDEEEKGILSRIKNLFMRRDPEEESYSEEELNENVPRHIKLKMWQYNWAKGNWGISEQESMAMFGEKRPPDNWEPTDEQFKEIGIEFWEVEPGNYGYEHSFEQGWIDESGRVYYGEQ